LDHCCLFDACRFFMDTTSVSLLRRLREPDQEAAWARFVQLYAPLIFHWGKEQGLTATDAADLVQEVLAVLVAKLPEFEYDPQHRFRGWLKKITVNRGRDFRRRNTLRSAESLDESVHGVGVASQVDLFEESEYRVFLVRRAAELMQAEFGATRWQACWRHIVEGKTAAEVARDLGISVNMVYLAKSRVLARLREELDRLV
jgi:RNA polymerase sigma-70 factor (ECF subfamily)